MSANTTADALEAAIGEARTPQAVTVYRGLPPSLVQQLTAGCVVQDPGFLSTSVDPTVAMRPGGATLMLHVPAGTPYASGAQGAHPYEGEVVLPAASRVRITGVQHGQDTQGGAHPFITATLEGQR